jgi:hypothetical protein
MRTSKLSSIDRTVRTNRPKPEANGEENRALSTSAETANFFSSSKHKTDRQGF